VNAQAPGWVWIAGDVSTKAGVKAVGEAVRAQTERVDVLLNNAGGTFDTGGRTADGIERTLALNVLGPWLLEKELHAALATAKGRVVNVATGFLDRYPVDVDDLPAPKRYSGLTQYARAKNALVMLTIEQAARFAPEGITVVSLNPGIVMGTRFGGGQPKIAQWIGGPIMRAIGIASTLDGRLRRRADRLLHLPGRSRAAAQARPEPGDACRGDVPARPPLISPPARSGCGCSPRPGRQDRAGRRRRSRGRWRPIRSWGRG
jgi:NAD(P)-dependent dehydrogenase (short-subunit alcohol dehydrogenase family)